MNVFEFRERVIEDYERFARSFTRIKATDIKAYVDAEVYGRQHFWPMPLIQINPNFVIAGSIDDRVREGVLDAECQHIFRRDKDLHPAGKLLKLYKHQDDAIRLAQKQENYVLTTGTGSGKSLAYFIPIVDHVLKARKAHSQTPGTTAIVIYPMNALCNSQLEELEKYLKRGYGDGTKPVTFARYTGQESEEARSRIAAHPPDILLTNYVMLELIMTRQDETDKAVVRNAQGLSFLVLDELHTYRGRQGADVALLIRRVREALNPDLLCVGTSATMATEGHAHDRRKAVAAVASKLFGSQVKPSHVIAETLARTTPEEVALDAATLRQSMDACIPTDIDTLRHHPMSAWVELNLGLEQEEGEWVRMRQPQTLAQAATRLEQETGIGTAKCTDYLVRFLLQAYNTRQENGRPLFAFRLHQFISGAGDLFATLEPAGQRYLTVNGQQFKPGDRDKRLFNTAFCRECGQEYYPVWARILNQGILDIKPRALGDRSNENSEAEIQFGYFMPDTEGEWQPEPIQDTFPESWWAPKGSVPMLKPYFKPRQPRSLRVNALGIADSEGLAGWFIPGAFRFCLGCATAYDGTMRSEFTKLSRLSTEGRSSATTVLTLAALRYLLQAADTLPPEAKKLLGFTDSRQDASLQAGHFNDFVQILVLRSALLAAIQDQPTGMLKDDILTQEVYTHLWMDEAEGMDDFADNPAAKGIAAENTKKALREVLGYRLYHDLQRGWRITNPNLEQLGLLWIDYLSLDDCCANEDMWASGHPLLAQAKPKSRQDLARELLDTMRRRLCIKTLYLDDSQQEQIRHRSYTLLKEPWGLSEEENMTQASYMVPTPRSPGPRDRAFHLSYRSRFARKLKHPSTWDGIPLTDLPDRINQAFYASFITALLDPLITYGIVEPVLLHNQTRGYQINANMLQWRVNSDIAPSPASNHHSHHATHNRFFRQLYRNVASSLRREGRMLHRLEAREHTAQVAPIAREQREGEFRKAHLPVLFCSPTMELGVDIAELNTVFMRNVPPTPANYAQRSGRAGRSGQPALVITYCAAQSPHDQYFFADPTRMVAGRVNPPALDLANEELIRSHLQAIWLSETGKKLPSSPSELLETSALNDLPLHTDYKSIMDAPQVRARAHKRGRTIAAMLTDDLAPDLAPWYTPDWLERVINTAFRRFDEAFDPWRSLFRAATQQLHRAHGVQMNAAATEKERRGAQQRYNEARIQRELLLDTRASINADFYTYRYLASHGFLPGYNFPRLPLQAFIPARRAKIGRDSFLSRPRFLGLSEFGPRSIIYHEGSQYQVHKAILRVSDEASVTAEARLPTRSTRICSHCGYGHFGEQYKAELCEGCQRRLANEMHLSSLFRIEHVSTRRVMRITSDEEERQRLGYEMQTTFQYVQENGVPQIIRAVFSADHEEILNVAYGPAATVWRINLGWLRRSESSIYGFNIDVATGYWSRDEQAPDADSNDAGPNDRTIQRITPYVEDRRNILIIAPSPPLEAEGMATLQYALKRGIEGVFQLEDSELMAEPLPRRDNRRALLFYESAEGGAGVLTRLARDPKALSRVARKALEICHWSAPDPEGNADTLVNQESECEAGCYRCLLSYFNQSEHREIDRKHPAVLDLLCRLTRANRRMGTEGRNADEQFSELSRLSGSTLEQAWLQHVRESGYHLPDRAQVLLEAYGTRPDYVYREAQALIYVDGPHHDQNSQRRLDRKITHDLENGGFTVIRFPKETAYWPAIFAAYPDVFGQDR